MFYLDREPFVKKRGEGFFEKWFPRAQCLLSLSVCALCVYSVTESKTEPLTAQLHELDSAIADQLGQIAAAKSTILHQDQRVAKLLGSVAKS